MQYLVEVSEVLSRKVLVEADNEDEAIQRVEEAYMSESIVLDCGDFHGDMTITCLSKEK